MTAGFEMSPGAYMQVVHDQDDCAVFAMDGLTMTVHGAVSFKQRAGEWYATGPETSPKTGVSETRLGALLHLLALQLGYSAAVRPDSVVECTDFASEDEPTATAEIAEALAEAA